MGQLSSAQLAFMSLCSADIAVAQQVALKAALLPTFQSPLCEISLLRLDGSVSLWSSHLRVPYRPLRILPLEPHLLQCLPWRLPEVLRIRTVDWNSVASK